MAMKQSKISSFFAKCGEEKLKRPLEDDGPGPSQGMKATKRRRQGGGKSAGKSKPDKENGFRKLVSPFAVNPQPRKAVLSPKKLTENVVVGKPDQGEAYAELVAGFGDFDDPMPEPEDAWCTSPDLALDKPVRCQVMRCSITSSPKCEQVVFVRAEGSEKLGVCKLRDMWTFLSLSTGDDVTVKAHSLDGEWVVNAKDGYVILHPNLMMPITSLVNGMFCLRRGVLTSLYKCNKSNVKVMILGRIVHELLQEALRKKLDTEEELMKVLDGIMSSPTYLRDMYLNDFRQEEASSEASNYVPKILNFLNTYLKGGPKAHGRFQGQIKDVLEIEELVTSNKLGIQGRVDVTVRVEEKSRERIMPLEVKTGRASFSKEHRIQVILYSLLLDELLRNVESGLLLYLREGVMEEVTSDPSELRNLLILRNEFVRFFRDAGVGDSLPEPIRSTACRSCSHSRLCLTYLHRDGLDNLPPSHPIREMDFPDLAPSHVQYFFSWLKMVYLECKPSDEGIVEDLVHEATTQVDEKFRVVFSWGRKSGDVRVGSTIILKTESRVVGRGRLLEISDRSCILLLDVQPERGERYQLETSSFSLLQMYTANLGYFMEGEYHRLRQLIVDRVTPRCETKITKRVLSEDCLKVLRNLNRDQQKAVFKTIAANEYLLIRGPPGTGKTETIVALIKLLLLQNQTVLVTGHTHSSVDNILLKLTGVEYVRFGSLSSVDRNIHSRCYAKLIEDCRSVEDVGRLYDCPVVASTCLGVELDLLGKRTFDVCLMDESSQVTQAEAIRPLLFARKFVLIGDSNQLPPVVKSPEAKKSGMDVSIFEWLESEATTVTLTQQYRMNRVLNDLANRLTYGGVLQCGSPTLRDATLRVAGSPAKKWLRDVLSPRMEMSVVFVDTCEHVDPGSKASGCTNLAEASVVARLAKELAALGVRGEDIGVISPFCDQVRLLTSVVDDPKIEVSTIDQYQGRDKDVVIFSCTKQTRTAFVQTDSNHILNDRRRINVAVTRAKVKLILVGDLKSVSVYPSINQIISSLADDQIIRLRDGHDDFHWHEL